MRMSRPSRAAFTALTTLLVFASTLALGAAAETAQSAPPAAAAFGEVFPGGTFTNINAGGGGAPKIDLRAVIGKTPVVFCYWIPQHARAEETLQGVQQIADEADPSKLAVFGVAVPPVSATEAAVQEWLKTVKDRIAALKIHVPVLQDDGFKLGRLLGVRAVPSVSALDAEGRLRMANGGSLKQVIEYKMDVAGALRRLASTGRMGTYGPLPAYFPAVELVGKKCPEFEAQVLGSGATRSISSMLAPDKVNVLIFWAEDCPHCRKSLPSINAYLKDHPAGINVVTAAKILSDAAKTQTEEFCKQEGFVFPTLMDRELKIGQLFMVTSTPTIFIIRPDGVIDSVLFSGETDYSATFEEKKRRLLKSS